MSASPILPITHVRVQFDLRQSIDARGYRQPTDAHFRDLRRAFEDWLWYEVEEHWHDIVESTSIELAEKGSHVHDALTGHGDPCDGET